MQKIFYLIAAAIIAPCFPMECMQLTKVTPDERKLAMYTLSITPPKDIPHVLGRMPSHIRTDVFNTLATDGLPVRDGDLSNYSALKQAIADKPIPLDCVRKILYFIEHEARDHGRQFVPAEFLDLPSSIPSKHEMTARIDTYAWDPSTITLTGTFSGAKVVWPLSRDLTVEGDREVREGRVMIFDLMQFPGYERLVPVLKQIITKPSKWQVLPDSDPKREIDISSICDTKITGYTETPENNNNKQLHITTHRHTGCYTDFMRFSIRSGNDGVAVQERSIFCKSTYNLADPKTSFSLEEALAYYIAYQVKKANLEFFKQNYDTYYEPRRLRASLVSKLASISATLPYENNRFLHKIFNRRSEFDREGHLNGGFGGISFTAILINDKTSLTHEEVTRLQKMSEKDVWKLVKEAGFFEKPEKQLQGTISSTCVIS